MWFGRFIKSMVRMGYYQSQRDHTLIYETFFSQPGINSNCIYRWYYCDQKWCGGNWKYEKRSYQKDLKNGIFISLKKTSFFYLLKEIGMMSWKPSDIPIKSNHSLGEQEKVSLVDCGVYQRLVGKLIYLSHGWLNITYIINIVINLCICQRHMNFPIFIVY